MRTYLSVVRGTEAGLCYLTLGKNTAVDVIDDIWVDVHVDMERIRVLEKYV